MARVCDHKPYASAFTVMEITPIWAPSSDGNNTERNIAAVLADIERWVQPQAPGFADKCGQATAEAFADYLGWGGSLDANGGIYAAHMALWQGGITKAHEALWR